MQFHKGFGNILNFVLILFSLYLVCLASWRFVSEKHVSGLASVKKNLQTQKIRPDVEKIFDFQNSLTVAEKLYDDGGMIANDTFAL